MGKYSVTSLVSTPVTKRKNNRCIREKLNSLRHVPQIFLRERVLYGEMLEQEAERIFVMNYDTPWPIYTNKGLAGKDKCYVPRSPQ